jgi:hypothetical protein
VVHYETNDRRRREHLPHLQRDAKLMDLFEWNEWLADLGAVPTPGEMCR